jgi:hypothetical protein
METPGAVTDVAKGVGKAITLKNVVFVDVLFVVVVLLVKYFTKQEIVTVTENGEQKSIIKSTLGLPKKQAA